MERVLEIIEEQLHLTGMELTEDLNLKDDLGADSIDLAELIMAFEDEYGINADYEEMDKRVKTVGDIIEYLKEPIYISINTFVAFAKCLLRSLLTH